jgi:hypothetical protein
MFGKYMLPGDDIGVTYATGVTTSGSGSPVASDEDPDYPASNIISLNPARPAKLTVYSGYWELTFAAPVAIQGAAIIYHNFDAGLNVTVEGSGGSPAFSQAMTIPAHHEDGWPVSPWVLFSSTKTYQTWRLSVNAVNSQLPQVGRFVLIGELRQTTEDVLWGEEESEDHTIVEMPTELGIETIYALGGKRRHFSGEFGVLNTTAATLITLYRSASGRTLPWLLIPDTAVNDAWLVRFEESHWSRTRETYDHNRIPFRVQELARGLPWP